MIAKGHGTENDFVLVRDPHGRREITPALVRALALGRSLTQCLPGYALVDSAGFVRYRTYDPGLADHVDEQRVLLENLP